MVAKQINRPSWDDIWVGIALSLSKRSYDPRFQVGSLVVTEDNTQVLAVGYNGNHSGGPNEVESLRPGESGMLHAEINTLFKMDFDNPKKKKVYVTLSPCRMCAKAIINSNIDEVIYFESYRDSSGLDLLREAGIEVRQHLTFA